MKKVAIIGAGISGLFIANLFKNNSNYEIKIFEKDKLINLDEGYGIQLSVNSVRLLNKIEFHKFQNDKKFNPDKIIFNSNKSQDKFCDLYISDFNSHDCKYTTLKRSDLVSFLKDKIQDLIKTNHSISKVDQQNEKIHLTFENNETFECDYLIISDDFSLKSLKFSTLTNTQKAFQAGCNLVLHCNARMSEMKVVAENSPKLDNFLLKKTLEFYKLVNIK